MMSAEEKKQLKPCPFCGSTNLNVVQWIECEECGAFGPSPALDGNMSNWNSRPAIKIPPTEYFGDSWSGGYAIKRDDIVDALVEQGFTVSDE